MLRRYAGLDGEVSRKISQTYPTWDEFLRADPTHVARLVGVSRVIAQAIQNSIAEAGNHSSG